MSALEEVLEERRQFPGGNDGMGKNETRDPADIPMEDLLQRAEVHMQATACTHWDEDEKCYKFLPVIGTPLEKIGELGVGIQLYFQFLNQMGIVFLILFVLSFPLFVSCALGDMAHGVSGLPRAFGTFSLANLGACGDLHALCPDVESVRARTVTRDGDTKVSDLTPWFGTLDGIGLLVLASFGVFFRRYWISHMAEVHDAHHVTPADYSLRVMRLPRRLKDPEQHKQYEELLKKHFTGLLKERCGCKDEEPVVEISLVRDYERSLDEQMAMGHCLINKNNLEVKQKQEKDEKKKQGIQKQIEKVDASVVALQGTFSEAAKRPANERAVCNAAYIIFNREKHVKSLLYEHRFANNPFFPNSDKALFFQGCAITVHRPSEPSDVFWENMDLPARHRRCRIWTTCLLTILLLVVCFFIMITLQIQSKATAGEASPEELWVLKSPSDAQCLNLCEWKAFSEGRCREPADGLGGLAGVWDASGNRTAAGHPALAACAGGSWSSRACAAGAPQEPQWIGLQFEASTGVACMSFTQGAGRAQEALELYACSSETLAGLNGSALAAWRPEEHCIRLDDLKPSTQASGSWAPSGRQGAHEDALCARPVSYEAAVTARDAKAEFLQATDGLSTSDAKYKANTEDFTVDCYCKQQSAIVGATFNAPPFSQPNKALCKDWVISTQSKVGIGIAAVLVVCVLNAVLVLLFQIFSRWEQHETRTRATASLFFKLFMAQVFNTSMIVLIVNSNLRGTFSNTPLLGTAGVGTGSHDDFGVDWFAMVGSGICLTIFMQVFTATIPPVATSYIVTPLLIRFLRRGQVTQETLNRIHELPEWNLASRLAQSYCVICVILMYSGGMPILNLIGSLYCLVAYWMDKCCLLKGSHRPPKYDQHLLLTSIPMLRLGVIAHAILTLWAFGNQSLFPSDWSVFQVFLGGLVGINEEKYLKVTDDYGQLEGDAKDEIFKDYVHARMLDMGRLSCWLLLIVFFVFLVYYIVFIIVLHFLGPLLASYLKARKEKDKQEAEAAEAEAEAEAEQPEAEAKAGKAGTPRTPKTPKKGQGLAFADAVDLMVEKNYVPSYKPEQNPEYAVLMQSLTENQSEIEESMRDHAARQSTHGGGFFGSLFGAGQAPEEEEEEPTAIVSV